MGHTDSRPILQALLDIEYDCYLSFEVMGEPVGMERKLLFEIDLRDAESDDGKAQVLSALDALSRQAVEAGRLDEWGEHLFTDMRVRAALTKLATDPPPPFLAVVSAAVDGPVYGARRYVRAFGVC